MFVTSRSTLKAAAAILTVTLTAACAKSGDKADTDAKDSAAAATAAGAPMDTGMSGMSGMSGMAGMSGMSGMAGMTGNADQDFLRMMSDHHKGLIVLAHMTKDRKEGGTAVADATKLDAAQDMELDHMVTMLEKDFKDAYSPKVLPAHQAMADALKSKTGKEYDRTFYQNIIQHHQEAIKMVDGYLPNSKNAMLKQMAEKMKADQSKEIADFQKKVTALGS